MQRAEGWIDISVPVRSAMVSWPGDPPVEIKRVSSVEAGDTATVSHLSFGSHTGTHMDAPAHFIAGGASLDAISWQAVMGQARVLHLPGVRVVTAEVLKEHAVRKHERLLLKTENSTAEWWERPFQEDFVHLDESAAAYLAERGTLLIGVDYLSVSGYSDNPALVHRALLANGVWIVEGLNLVGVEAGDYELVCLPLKLDGGDGAPARALLRKAAQQ